VSQGKQVLYSARSETQAAEVLAKEFQSVKNLLVAIDDCEYTTIASPVMEHVIELAGAFSSKVWLLHVVPHAGTTPFNIDSKILRKESATELRHEHEFLQTLAQCLRDRGIEAKALLIEGTTINTINEESDRLDIDLIILGCHKHSMLYGALADVTEEGLLSKCLRPLMFVPVPSD
jgi:nucleotide-binding universal stress UspA family protein